MAEKELENGFSWNWKELLEELPWKWLVPVFVVFSLLPYTRLGTFALVSSPVAFPKEATYGEVFSLPINENIAFLQVDGETPSYSHDGKNWIFAFGLYEPGNAWITGLTQFEESSFWQRFTRRQLSYFVEKVQMKRPFPKKKGNNLRLPSSVWQKVSAIDFRKEKYKRTVRSLARNDDGKLVKSCWQAPLKSRINSQFGKPRNLPNGRTYYHSGVDLRARTGTPLRAPANGTIVFAEHAIVPGNTVIIYHGAGIQTQYMHLSKIKVAKGQRVKVGDVVGLAGATGRVEGPHLHWEMHWKGRKTNPFSFLETLGADCPQQNI